MGTTLALDPAYIEGFVEGCLERIGEEDPDEEQFFRDLWEDGGEGCSLFVLLEGAIAANRGSL